MIGGDYMDILFKNDDFVFSYRVGGILIHEGKILLQRPKNDNYAIIGGHVAAMETSMETLKREFEEEIHAKIEVDNLLAIGEIYFPWGKRPCHQISLYYNVHLVDDNIPLDGVFHGYDELDNERIDLDFCWVPLEDLKKGTKVYPLELIPYILEPGKFAVIVSRYDGKWVFCKHKERDTYEVPGGHREAGENIVETAKRELQEETGAVKFEIKPICVYSVTGKTRVNNIGEETFGLLCFAEITEFAKELHSEMEKVVLMDKLPENWTYPLIQPKLIEKYLQMKNFVDDTL